MLQSMGLQRVGHGLETNKQKSYNIMSFVDRDYFNSSFPVQVIFISFSCLIALVRTSNTIRDKSRQSLPCS